MIQAPDPDNQDGPSSYAGRLAEYVSRTAFDDLPAAVSHEASRAFLNFMGCALGGSHEEIVDATERALGRFSGPPQATLIGRQRRSDILLASLINCASSSVHSFDDSHAEAVVHPAGPVTAAILALAELAPVSGPDFLLALALGIDIECRVSKAISVPPARAELGWSQTGVSGGIGAAVAAGKLLGLDQASLAAAIGIAASQAAGLREFNGTMCMCLMPAHAAQTGLRAALLAQGGIASSMHSLEAKYGFTRMFAKEAHLASLIDGLGDKFEILSNTYKPYPCGIVINPIVDACLELKSQHDLKADAIELIQLRVNPMVLVLTDLRHPTDKASGQVSLYHWAAVAIMRGAAGLNEGDMDAIQDGAIAALRNRIEPIADSAIRTDEVMANVTLKDGRTWSYHVEHCRGSRERPLSDRELEQKFRNQAKRALAPNVIETLIENCWTIAHSNDVGAIARSAA